MIPSIEQLFKASNEGSYVHFPQAFMVWRTGAAWAAAITTGDKPPSAVRPQGMGETPEAAVADLVAKVRESIANRLSSHERDASKMREALSLVPAGGGGEEPR